MREATFVLTTTTKTLLFLKLSSLHYKMIVSCFFNVVFFQHQIYFQTFSEIKTDTQKYTHLEKQNVVEPHTNFNSHTPTLATSMSRPIF